MVFKFLTCWFGPADEVQAGDVQARQRQASGVQARQRQADEHGQVQRPAVAV